MGIELRIRSLGGLTITVDNRSVTGLASRKTAALLLYLAVTRRPWRREVLADLLWDDRSQERALGNLRVVLSSLRQELGAFVEIGREVVHLKPGADILVDVHQLELALASEENAIVETARDLYQGAFLDGFFIRDAGRFELWVEGERERLHQAVAMGLSRVVEAHLHSGRYGQGIGLAYQLLQLDPLSESAHHQLLALLARSGQRSSALAHFGLFRERLRRELGVEVEAETIRLVEAIRAGALAQDEMMGPALDSPARQTGPLATA